jgi:16S rRNA (guanine966-N2)-methyltransferase
LRIIAGLAKGRALHTPKGQATRPTADRVKEAIFSTLADRINKARVLDAFAGSGALGLEALSRGAKEAVFTEKDRSAFAALHKNIQMLDLPGAKAYFADCLRLISTWKEEKRQFDLVFLDPPYGKGLVDKALAMIQSADLLAPEAIVIIETAAKDSEVFLPQGLNLLKTARYGDTSISYYIKDCI